MTDKNNDNDMSTAASAGKATPKINEDTTVDTDGEEAEDTASGGPA